MTAEAKPFTHEDLDRLFDEVNNWGRWGADDQRGALNLITPEKRLRAASLVKDGVTVSASLPLATDSHGENPHPVRHTVIRGGDIEDADAATDYFSIAPHGLANTHLDALCHIFYKGQMYNGYSANRVNSSGALSNSIAVASEGIVGRGVLLDFPAQAGREWLEPGEAIYAEDLEQAEAAAGVRVEEGDILLVRTGRDVRNRERPRDRGRVGLAGLHASAMPWIRARGVAVLGSDGLSDVAPSGLEGMRTPVHMLTIAAMGIHLIDNCDLQALAEACASRRRWEFQFVMAPLVLTRGTASPVNPLAIF